MNKLSFSIIVLVSLWMFSACGSDETVKEKSVRPVKALTIGNFIDPTGKGFPGVTKENQETRLSFRIEGPIIKYNVVEGERVKKGALIAEIDPRDYKISVQSAKARYDQAKAESDRFYRLWKKKSVSKNSYDRRYATYLEAKAEWQDAKNALNDTKLYAPYTGFYGPKLVDVGDNVRQKEVVATIVDLSVIEVITTIPEQLAVQSPYFDRYEVHLETYPDIVFKATLKELEKKPTPEGFPLHLYLDHTNIPGDKAQVKVAAGMSCRVNIILKNASDVARKIIIPISAIFEGNLDESTMVWVINPDNTVKKQSVETGGLVGHEGIEITKGLKVGDRTVTAGVHRLSEGNEVNDIDILNSN